MTTGKMIISIGRECGSGGHEIGEKIAERYGLKLYDANLIGMLAEQTGEDPEKWKALEERVSGKLFGAGKGGYGAQKGALMSKMTDSDRLFELERGLILKLASEESFVIVGRAANAILADHPDTLKLYVYAKEEFKIPRVKEYYNLVTDEQARSKMNKVDKERRQYFNYYADKEWGSSDVHDFMLDSSLFGIDESVRVIADLIEKRFPEVKAVA